MPKWWSCVENFGNAKTTVSGWIWFRGDRRGWRPWSVLIRNEAAAGYRFRLAPFSDATKIPDRNHARRSCPPRLQRRWPIGHFRRERRPHRLSDEDAGRFQPPRSALLEPPLSPKPRRQLYRCHRASRSEERRV